MEKTPEDPRAAMPTTARLVAALFFAALGWFGADQVKPLLSPGTPTGLFGPVSAGFGLLVGWFFTGKRVGSGEGNRLGIGLTGAFLLAFWVLFTFSGYKMLQNSMRKYYDGPVEALQDMFSIAVDYIFIAAAPEVIATLVLGGLIGGWLAGWVARRWS